MRESVYEKGKGWKKSFWSWMLLGLVLFSVICGSFTILARQHLCNINMETLSKQSDQIAFSDGVLVVEGNDIQLHFELEKDIFINYITMTVKKANAPTINGRLYYAAGANDFNEMNVVNFYLRKGYNEIRASIGEKKYFRLDILGEGVEIDAITISSSANPLYHIPQGFLLFMIIWSMAYFTASKLGVHYNGIQSSIIMLLEGLFAICIIMTMLFAIGRIKYPLIVCMFIPFMVYMLMLLYSQVQFANRVRKYVLALLFAMTGVMCIVGYKMLSMQHTDLGTVYYSAWEIVNDGMVNTVYTGKEQHAWVFEASNNDYFVHYHNNIPILAILAGFYKLISIFGLGPGDMLSNYLSVLLNIVFIMSAVIFGMITAKNLLGTKGMYVYLLASVLFVPYYINACRFYTDTLSMPFVTLTCWLYTVKKDRFKWPFIKYGLIGMVLGVGILIKGSIVILFIAVCMHLLLNNIRNVRYALVTVIMVIGISAVWNIYIQNCSWIDMSNNNALECPPTHYLMMGINRDSFGNFSLADVNYTEQYESKADKVKANIDKIKQRIVGFGALNDLFEYEFSKAANTWFEGQYMQDEHISWGIKKGNIYEWLIGGRKYNALFKIYTQTYTYIMHIFVIAGVLLNIKKSKADYAMFLRLTMLGVIFFFMLWESKSRYILNFTPVFMLAAIYGAEEIRNKLSTKKHATYDNVTLNMS